MFLLLPRYSNFMLPTVQIMSEYNIFFINNHIWLVSLFFIDLPPVSLWVIRISLSVFKTDVQDNRSWLWFLCLLELCFALDTWLVPSALVHVQMFKPQTPTLKQYARNWCRGEGNIWTQAGSPESPSCTSPAFIQAPAAAVAFISSTCWCSGWRGCVSWGATA